MLKLTYLSFLLALMALQVNAEIEVNKLESVCAEKLNNVQTISDMLWVIDQMEQFRAADRRISEKMERCVAEYNSIVDLKHVIDVGNSDVCRPDRVKAIIDYQHKHIDVKSKIYGNKRERMVRHFFRRFALQVSLICRNNMIENILEANEKATSENQRFILSNLGSQSYTLLARINKFKKTIASTKTIGTMMRTMMITMPLFDSKRINQTLDISLFEEAVPICKNMSSYFDGAILSPLMLDYSGFGWIDGKTRELKAITEAQRHIVGEWVVSAMICSPFLKRAEQDDQLEYYEYDRNKVINPDAPFALTDKMIADFEKGPSILKKIFSL